MSQTIIGQLQICWTNMVPSEPSSPALKDAVLAAVHAQVPESIRNAWAYLPLQVDDDGGMTHTALRDFLQAEVDRLNEARRLSMSEPPDFALSGEAPEDCTYTYVNNTRVCYYTQGIQIGAGTWEVDDPDNQSPDAILGLQIRWETHAIPDAS